MKRVRPILTVLIFVAVLGISLAATVQVFRQGIPTAEAQTDTEAELLIGELIEREASQFRRPVQLQFLNRLQYLLERGADLRGRFPMPPRRRAARMVRSPPLPLPDVRGRGADQQTGGEPCRARMS